MIEPATAAVRFTRLREAWARLRGGSSPELRGVASTQAVALREMPTLWMPACAGIAAGGSSLELWYWLPLSLAAVLAHFAQSALRGPHAPWVALPPEAAPSLAPEPSPEGERGSASGGSLRAKAVRLAVTHSVLVGLVLLSMVRRRLVSSLWPVAAAAAGLLVALLLANRRVSWAWSGLWLRGAFVAAGALMARSPMLSGLLWLLSLLAAHGLALQAGFWIARARRSAADPTARAKARWALVALNLALLPPAAFAAVEVRGAAAIAFGATYALFVARALVETLRRDRVDLASWAPGLCLVEGWVLSAFGFPALGLVGLLAAALSWLLLSSYAAKHAPVLAAQAASAG